MDKDKKLKIALPFLLIISVFVWISVLKPSGKKGDVKKETTGSESVLKGQSSTESLLLDVMKLISKKDDTVSLFDDWGRNPFVLEGINENLVDEDSNVGETEKIEPDNAMVLNGIIWNIDKPSALINDTIARVGDTIGRSIVVDIKPDVVILNNDEGNYELRLNKY